MGIFTIRKELERVCDDNKRLAAENAKLTAENMRLMSDNERMRDYITQRQAEEQRAAMKLDQQWRDFWRYDGTPQNVIDGGVL